MLYSTSNRRSFLKMTGAGAASLALTNSLHARTPAGAQRSNFVFILADDFGWADLGCYGSTFYETPSLDALAAQGMRFTDAYASCPVCSPTRASLLTGKYPARLHLTDWIPGNRRGKLNPAPYLHHLPLEEITVAEALKAAGYATGFIGKWHLGGDPYCPENQGFDVNVAGCSLGSPPSYFSPYHIPTLTDGPPGEYLTDRLTDEAIRFIDQHKAGPFLVYLSHYAVHNPQEAKAGMVEKYQKKAAALPPHSGPEFIPEGAWRDRRVQDKPVYAAMVESMDESVGRITRRLAELGLDNNTIVVFTSDNGGLSTAEGAPTSNAPLRDGKGWLYEGGVREPLIVRWPGVTKPGSTTGCYATSTDIYPTFLEMAGLPPRPEQHRDGVSLVPVLKGGTMPARPLFWHYPHYSNQGGGPGGAVRLGDEKLIEWLEDGRVELYNLSKDLGERNDLAKVMPARAAELKDMLHKWREGVDATMPTPNPDWRPPTQGHAPAQADDAAGPLLASRPDDLPNGWGDD